jgi:anti-sigma B factor antagonist
MNITIAQENGTVVITLQGEVDECGAEEIKAQFRDVSQRAPLAVAVDFAGVSHIGSAGIGKLLVFYKDLAMRGASLSLVRVPPLIYELFCEMKLDTIFAITAYTGQADDTLQQEQSAARPL